MTSWPFCLIISKRISCSRALSLKAAIDELRRSSGGGVEPLAAACDELWCGIGDETLIIGVIGADVDDLLESVGEIGGETDKAPLTGIDKYSDGDFVGIGGNGGGRWAAEMLANKVWNEALAVGEYIGWCSKGGGGARWWNWLK